MSKCWFHNWTEFVEGDVFRFCYRTRACKRCFKEEYAPVRPDGWGFYHWGPWERIVAAYDKAFPEKSEA